MNSSLRKPAETAVEQCMDLQPGETCAVVTDDKRQAIGEALYAVASEITDDAIPFRPPGGPARRGTARTRRRRDG